MDKFPTKGEEGEGGRRREERWKSNVRTEERKRAGFGRENSSMSLLAARDRKLSRSEGALNIRQQLMIVNEEEEEDEESDEYGLRCKDEDFPKFKPKRKEGITKVPEIMFKFLKTNTQRTKRRKESFISRIISNDKDEAVDDNSLSLRYAVRKFDTGRVIEIVSRPNTNIDGTSDKGITALHEAAIDGNLTCVKLLANHGANINKCDCEGFTPLDYAVFGGNFECAAYLIEKGAKEDRIRDGQIVLSKDKIYRDSKERRSTFS